MAAFSWLTWLEANQEVSVRLGDPSQVFWGNAEVYAYLTEALRLYNCMTAFWEQDYVLDVAAPPASNWQAANGSGSPRQQTLTSTDVFTLIQYHLLEPPAGQTWTGTDQFNITDLVQAVSRRLNEMLQVAACNMEEIELAITPSTMLASLPDTALDVRRVRWVPAEGLGSPATPQRADSLSFQRFSVNYPQTMGTPLRWDVLGSPPQVITLDTNIAVPSDLEALCVTGAPDFVAGTPSGLFIPDDWMWVLKFGAMADILSMEQEGKDLERAAYCRQRYMEGLQLMQRMPWLLQGFLNGVPVDTQAVAAADRFNYEWQSNAAAFPEIVVGGIDLFALSPTPTADTAVTLKVVGNAPIPAADGDPVQVTRDAMDAIISEAQHLALLKCGGKEFSDSMALHKEFVKFCIKQDARMRLSGIFATDLRAAVPRQSEQQPRFAMSEKE